MASDDAATTEPIEILLVEPNPGDTRLFTESFADAKLTNSVHTVSDGDAALEFVRQNGEYTDHPKPDLILLEPQLPGRSGLEILSELNDDAELDDIPVVVLTSSDVGEEIVRSQDLDADHYLQKPVDSDEFIDFVQSVEDFWLAIVEQAEND